MKFLINIIIAVSLLSPSDKTLSNDVRWVRDSKEYDKITESIFFNAIQSISAEIHDSSFQEIEYSAFIQSLKNGDNVFDISQISCSKDQCVGKFKDSKELGFVVKIPKLSNSLINKLKRNKILYQFEENLEIDKISNHRYAIVVDLDETILDNSDYQVMLSKTNQSFSQKSWSEWVQQEDATIVPGAKKFLDTARLMGVRIIFLSNRMNSNLSPTINNLKKLNLFSDDDIFLLRLNKADTKVVRRDEIYSKSNRMKDYPAFTVISYLGDSFGDFPEDSSICIWGDNCHVFPNPMYGKW